MKPGVIYRDRLLRLADLLDIMPREPGNYFGIEIFGDMRTSRVSSHVYGLNRDETRRLFYPHYETGKSEPPCDTAFRIRMFLSEHEGK